MIQFDRWDLFIHLYLNSNLLIILLLLNTNIKLFLFPLLIHFIVKQRALLNWEHRDIFLYIVSKIVKYKQIFNCSHIVS